MSKLTEQQELEADALITRAVQILCPELAMVTSFVLVVEAIDGDGLLNITCKRERNGSNWKAHGMLHYALYNLEPSRDTGEEE